MTKQRRSHGRRWDSTDMVLLAELYGGGSSYEEMAQVLGRSTGSIRGRIGVLRIAFSMRSSVEQLQPVEVLRTKKKEVKD